VVEDAHTPEPVGDAEERDGEEDDIGCVGLHRGMVRVESMWDEVCMWWWKWCVSELSMELRVEV
jgi:hypothetical protein